MMTRDIQCSSWPRKGLESCFRNVLHWTHPHLYNRIPIQDILAFPSLDIYKPGLRWYINMEETGYIRRIVTAWPSFIWKGFLKIFPHKYTSCLDINIPTQFMHINEFLNWTRRKEDFFPIGRWREKMHHNTRVHWIERGTSLTVGCSIKVDLFIKSIIKHIVMDRSKPVRWMAIETRKISLSFFLHVAVMTV